LDPVKQKLLNRSDLRLYTAQDKIKRLQTVALHNGGGVPLTKVFVALKIQPEVENPIADFYFASSDTVPLRSLMDCLSHSESWIALPPAEKEQIAPIADDHSTSRTLYDLDRAFNGILESKLQSIKTFKIGLEELRKDSHHYDDWHNSWIKQCEGAKRAGLSCADVENAVENWEYTKRDLQTKALKAWRETTGVELIPSSRQLSPNGLVHFAFALGADESAFLQIRYGPNPMPFPTPEIISNPSRNPTIVGNRGDLSASSFWIFLYYYPLYFGFWLAAILVGCFLAWPLLRPASLLPTHKVFNLALQTNDPAHWELASQREKYRIFQEHRRWWNRFKATPVQHSAEEIFEFIKNCAIDERENDGFASQDALNNFVERKLRQLARLP